MNTTVHSNVVIIEISGGAIVQMTSSVPLDVVVVDRDLCEEGNGDIQGEAAYTHIHTLKANKDTVRAIYADAVRNITNNPDPVSE